jgi:hypothetical protein
MQDKVCRVIALLLVLQNHADFFVVFTSFFDNLSGVK